MAQFDIDEREGINMSALACIWTNARATSGGVVAKPNRKAPTTTVEVLCATCSTVLYKYRKGGKGALVKCFKERIVVDHTERPCICPSCGTLFARETIIRGVPAYKMIGGKARIG